MEAKNDMYEINETLASVLEIPLILRASVVMFVIWLLYVCIAGLLFRVVMLTPLLFNWAWSIIYKLFNVIMHILHRKFGKPFIGADQTATDFFGGVYGFADRIKSAINNSIQSKRFFKGIAFLALIVLTIWIALPTWLNAEQDVNWFTAAYRRYIEIERTILDMIFSGDAERR